MKDLFKGYYSKSEEETKEIWDNAIITFDTNVLLNLYRYSTSTQKELLKIIEKFQDRIWLCHQASLEYCRNRYEVIVEQEKAYNKFNDEIGKIEDGLRTTSRPPFLSDKLHKELESVFKRVKKEVNKSSKTFSNMLKDDNVYKRINEIFDKKIGEGFDQNRCSQIYKLGEERYKAKIPPGFEDEKNKEGVRKYGDLMLWEQIKEKALESKQPIILITDERKKDWWWKLKDNRTMGPRQELVQELWDVAKVDFLMYSSGRFLSFSSNYFKEKINEQALKELTERKRIDSEKSTINRRSLNSAKKLFRARSEARTKNEERKERLSDFEKNYYRTKIDALKQEIELLNSKGALTGLELSQFRACNYELVQLKNELLLLELNLPRHKYIDRPYDKDEDNL